MKPEVDRLISKLALAHERSLGAYRRYQQYAGYETGRKARERHEQCEAEFEDLIVALRRAINGGEK